MSERRDLVIVEWFDRLGRLFALAAQFRSSNRAFIRDTLKREASAIVKRTPAAYTPFGLWFYGRCVILGVVNLFDDLFLNDRVFQKISRVLGNLFIGDTVKLCGLSFSLLRFHLGYGLDFLFGFRALAAPSSSWFRGSFSSCRFRRLLFSLGASLS